MKPRNPDWASSLAFGAATPGSPTFGSTVVEAPFDVSAAATAPEVATSRLARALSWGTPAEAGATDDSATGVGADTVDAAAGTEALSADAGVSKVRTVAEESFAGTLVGFLPVQ